MSMQNNINYSELRKVENRVFGHFWPTCSLNQLPQIPAYNNLPSSQHESRHTPVVSVNLQVPAPVAVQCNVVTPTVLRYGPTSHFTNSFPPSVPMQQHFGNYQTIGSVPEATNDVRVKSQSEADSQWISQWLVARKNRKTVAKNKTPISIPEVRKLLSQAFTFLKALAFVRDSLKSSRSESNETWDNKINQAITIKQRLAMIIQKLLKPETTVQLVRKLNRIKKKRELHRRQREKRKMEKLERQKKRLEIHRLLDLFMETEKEKVLQAKREEELKKEADNILSEVRKKLQEGKRVQERLRAIERLRQARKDTAQKRGLHISEERDNQFSKKMSLLNNAVHKQLQDYEAEEKALKVMLETEQEGQREQEEFYCKERQKKLVENMQKQMKECLFGDDEPLDASDPLWHYTDYYTQAERSLEALAQIRHQWDIYLVRPADACGSSIPISWVTPEPPSSDVWASALDLK